MGGIVVSSELPELLGLSDRIYTIFEGQITGCLTKEQADQESLMRLMTKTSGAGGVALDEEPAHDPGLSA